MVSSFSPTPAELTLVAQLFFKADPQNLGFIPTDVAVRLSTGAKVSPVTIGDIFAIADEAKSGTLSRKDIAVVVRLIGWAQKGEKITRSLLATPGPLAVIEGINVLGSQNTGMSLPGSPPPAAFPPLTPQDRTKFQNLFLKAGSVNGALSGDKARDLFLKSNLSNEQLMLIWNLADTQDRGYLDVIDFAIGMYLIQGVMGGSISFIPTTLPPGLYQQAAGITPPPPSVQPQANSPSRSFSPVRSTFVPPSTSAATSQPLQLPHTAGFNAASPKVAPALPARPSGNFQQQANGLASDWDVTPTEKASADRFFETLDTLQRGYIEGEAAVPFMLKSQLHGEVLAQIWDLADIHHDGRLTRDGFAIAMHLIQKRLAGHDVPFTLPPSLIPPSLRATMLDRSPFSPASGQSQPERDVNLLELEDTPPPSASHSQSMSGPMSPTSRQAVPQVPDKDPFSVPFQSSASHDFFGDDTSSPPFHDQSAEIGNVRNQLISTEKSVSAAKEERQTLEQNLADQAVQLSTLQTQLSSAKASYETEMSLLSTLKERRSAQLAEIQKTREELIRAESDLSAIRVEKTEIEGVFLRDKEEARELHRRMVETGQQADALKANVERFKREAKQQRGLLAIARKQLISKETEKAKAEMEHEEAVAEAMTLNEEKNALDAEIACVDSSPAPNPRMDTLASSESLMFAAAQPLPATPDLSQSFKSSNNPFERLAKTTTTSRSQSPFLGLQNAGVVSSPPSHSDSSNGTTPPLDVGATPSTVNAATTTEQLSLLVPSSDTGVDLTPLQIGDSPDRMSSQTPNEDFVTPPTSAIRVTTSDSTSSAAEKFPALEYMSTPFTSTVKGSSPPPVVPNLLSEETDLNSFVDELDDEGSDSDSDSEYEVEVGAASAKPLTNGNTDPGSASPLPDGKAVTPTVEDFASPQPGAVSSPDSFDEIFETSAPQPQPQVPAEEKASFFDVFIPPSENPKTSLDAKPVEETLRVAGVDEFDKTLNSSPPAFSSAAGPINFFADSFGDNFDFDAAKVEFPTVPDTTQTHQQASSTFDNFFGTATVPAPAPTSADPASLPPLGKFNSTFNDIFDNFAGPSISRNKPTETETPSAVAVAPASTASPVPSNEDSMPGAFPSQPVTPITSRTSTEREKASPARVGSPKLRITTPTKDTFEKVKETPHRHRLSIKLPFRKKKQPAPMPAPPSTPPLGEPLRSKAGEDVEPVQQLVAMGFERDQAVKSLEKYDYSVPRALNNLLGNP